MKHLLIAAALVMLAACSGSGVSGEYVESTTGTSYTFNSGNTVKVSTFGIELEVEYEQDKDKVMIRGPQGALVLTVQDDGSLAGPMGLVFEKK